MKIGFFTANYAHLSIEEVAKIASDHGYEMLEIPSYLGNGQLDTENIVKDKELRNRVLKTVKDHGLEISALSNHADSLLILGPHSSDTDKLFAGTKEEKIKYGTDSLILSAQAAHDMEIPIVIGFTGVTNWGRYFPFPSATGWSEMEEEFTERFTPILDKFKEYGVKFAVEPHPNNFIYDIHTALKAVELVDNHPNFGYNLDPANLVYLGEGVVENFIDMVGDRIFHVHAKDGEVVKHNIQRGGILMQGDWQRLDRAFRFRIPGWGSVNWKHVITELAMVGYDYVLSYEHEDVTMSVGDGVEKVIAFLQPLIIKAPYEGRRDKIFNNPRED
ncbi:MAG TPA: sugar phosphate isomerase/epimerase [Fastidiosipila sp.]|nr:sugar phosphate isomerase/epimerase [Fastidiosipila sp.]